MSAESPQPVYVVPSRGWTNKDISGEYYYQDAILPLLPRLPGNGDPVEAELVVDLVPEKDNPHDRRAVSIRSGDKVLGYLPKEMAAEYALPVQRIVASGATARANASVYAYLNSWKKTPEIQARVSLPEPELMTPLNNRYPMDTSILPFGRSYQVTKEENHFDLLFDYVPKSGTGMVILTMHRKESMLKNGTTKEVVEVRLDGERAGELTSATSQHYLPLIQHASDMDRTLGIWSKLTGSGVAAELTIHGVKSSEVSDDWLNEMPVVPRLIPEAHSYDLPPAYTGQSTPSKKSGQRARVSPSSRQPAQSSSVDLGSYGIDFGADTGSDAAHATGNATPNGERTITVGSSKVEITDKDRKSSPGTHRGGGIALLVTAFLVGGLLGSIPGIGPFLFLIIMGGAVILNRQMRLTARALELEREGRSSGPTLRQLKKSQGA